MIKLRKNISFLIIAVGIVLIWRGVWGLADTFLFPNITILSFLASIGMGILVLLIHEPDKLDLRELE